MCFLGYIKYHLYRWKNPDLYRRLTLSKKVKDLADFICSNELTSFEIANNGDSYVVMPDGVKLFYNTDISKGTLGDGQGLDYYGTKDRYLQDASVSEKIIFSYLKDNSVYVDVGANNGYFYALQIAQKIKGAKLYCFEPDPYILPHLKNNIRANSFDHQIKLIEKGVSDQDSEFYLRKGLGASGYLVKDKPDNLELYHRVQTMCLDQFFETGDVSKIDLIKVDIEGGEYRFLNGAKKILETYQPVLLIELRDELLKRSGTSFDDVSTMLFDMGYTLYKSPYNDDYFAVCDKHKLDKILKDEQFTKI